MATYVRYGSISVKSVHAESRHQPSVIGADAPKFGEGWKTEAGRDIIRLMLRSTPTCSQLCWKQLQPAPAFAAASVHSVVPTTVSAAPPL